MRLKRIGLIFTAILSILTPILAKPLQVTSNGLVVYNNVFGEKPGYLIPIAKRVNSSLVLWVNTSKLIYNATTGTYYVPNLVNTSQLNVVGGLTNTLKNTTVLVLTGTNTLTHTFKIPYYNQITSGSLTVYYTNTSTSAVTVSVYLNGNLLGNITLASGSSSYTFTNIQSDLIPNATNIVEYKSTGSANITETSITYTHTPTIYKVGNISGMLFDGLNDYIDLPDTLLPSPNDGNRTIIVWVKLPPQTTISYGNHNDIIRGYTNFGMSTADNFNTTGNIFIEAYPYNNGSAFRPVFSIGVNKINKLVYLAATFEYYPTETYTVVKGYLNYTLKVEKSIHNILKTATGNFMLGNGWGGPILGFIGKVFVFNKALPSSFIKLLYDISRLGKDIPVDFDGSSRMNINSIKYENGKYLLDVTVTLPLGVHYIYLPTKITKFSYPVITTTTDEYGNVYDIVNVSNSNTASFTLEIPANLTTKYVSMIVFPYNNKIYVAGDTSYINKTNFTIDYDPEGVYYNSTYPVTLHVTSDGTVQIRAERPEILSRANMIIKPKTYADVKVLKFSDKIIEFNATSVEGSPVYFIIKGLHPGDAYALYVDGKYIDTYKVNRYGKLTVGWDRWSKHHFVIKFAYASSTTNTPVLPQRTKPKIDLRLVLGVLLIFIILYIVLRRR